jgi:hypothetical protein
MRAIIFAGIRCMLDIGNSSRWDVLGTSTWQKQQSEAGCQLQNPQ